MEEDDVSRVVLNDEDLFHASHDVIDLVVFVDLDVLVHDVDLDASQFEHELLNKHGTTGCELQCCVWESV